MVTLGYLCDLVLCWRLEAGPNFGCFGRWYALWLFMGRSNEVRVHLYLGGGFPSGVSSSLSPLLDLFIYIKDTLFALGHFVHFIIFYYFVNFAPHFSSFILWELFYEYIHSAGLHVILLIVISQRWIFSIFTFALLLILFSSRDGCVLLFGEPWGYPHRCFF